MSVSQSVRAKMLSPTSSSGPCRGAGTMTAPGRIPKIRPVQLRISGLVDASTCCLEALLDEREKFILVQSTVVVGVDRGEILGVEPAAQFTSVEGAVMIAVELVE